MMKMQKKLFTLMLCVFMITVSLTNSVYAANGYFFQITSGAGKPGDIITISVSINNAKDTYAFQCNVNYNTSALKLDTEDNDLNGYPDGVVLPEAAAYKNIFTTNINNTVGTVFLGGVKLGDGNWTEEGARVVAELKFKVLPTATNGSHQLTFHTVEVVNSNADILTLGTHEVGIITVTGGVEGNTGNAGNTGNTGNAGKPTPPTPTQPPVVTTPAPIATTQTPSSKPSPVDIVEVSWAQEYIQDVIDKGIMKGYVEADGQTSFKPKGTATRAEFATALFNYLGFQKDGTKTFSDTQDHWAKDYIAKMVKEGIMTGYSDDQFAPGDPVTREQIATILNRAFKPQNTPLSFQYTDNTVISSWANDSVYAVRWASWMSGDVSGAFRPKDTATRAEIATIFSRLAKQGVAR